MAALEAERILAAADRDQVAMLEERVILTDYYDNDIGSGSKKETHIWDNIEAGMLHRAFSVFLFTPDGKLVLQQRSGAKITFPYIWANTCCSHPLHVPSERITKDAMGVKNAARRKLEHELGIPPEDVPLECFTWITRVHYVGASEDNKTAKGGKKAAPVWGEHEIDWILMCTPPKMPRMALNVNEVEQVKMFTQPELKEWMATRHERGEEVSPWFGVMEKSLLYKWWDAVLANRLDTVLQRDVIHRQHDLESSVLGMPVPMPRAFVATLAATSAPASSAIITDDSFEFRPKAISADGVPSASARGGSVGGDGQVGVSKGQETAVKPKQGAYGKVRIHSESLISQLSHGDEVMEALAYKMGCSRAIKVKPLDANATEAERFCESMLVKVSRSFAVVIQQLPAHLRQSICVFYLVLRGLDTVEDDMKAFIGRQQEKLHHLRNFYKYLTDPEWKMFGVGEGDEATLLQQFYYVNQVFMSLPATEQTVIADICRQMGEGMASFSGRDLREGTLDADDYNLYCHYVAGLVGEGLSRLFVARGDEDPIVAQDLKLADDMGLFLQKTNIIRDYLEDLVEGRAFWPRDVWSQYAPALANLRHKVESLTNTASSSTPANAQQVPLDDARFQEDEARACLNHLIADALTLVPSCLRYMERIKTEGIFRFCAIPQAMAIATLAKMANNADVFTGVVKLRKGQTLVLFKEASNMQNLYNIFLNNTRHIVAAIPRHHKAAYAIATKAAAQIEAICLAGMPVHNPVSPLFSSTAVVIVLAVFALLMRHLYFRSRSGAWSGNVLPRITDSVDVAVLTCALACVMYLFACAGVPVVLGLSSNNSSGAAASSPKAAAAVAKAKTVESVEAEEDAVRRRSNRLRA